MGRNESMLIPTVFRILEAHSPREPVEQPAAAPPGEFARILAEEQAAGAAPPQLESRGESVLPPSAPPIGTGRALVDSIRSLEAVERAARDSKVDIFE